MNFQHIGTYEFYLFEMDSASLYFLVQSLYRLSYVLEYRGSISGKSRGFYFFIIFFFSFCHRFQTGSPSHPASYQMGIGGRVAFS